MTLEPDREELKKVDKKMLWFTLIGTISILLLAFYAFSGGME